jgi:ABC-type phosphate transport system permease subunit
MGGWFDPHLTNSYQQESHMNAIAAVSAAQLTISIIAIAIAIVAAIALREFGKKT